VALGFLFPFMDTVSWVFGFGFPCWSLRASRHG